MVTARSVRACIEMPHALKTEKKTNFTTQDKITHLKSCVLQW